MSIATATIHGRLTREPEVRYTATGTAIANFSVAVNRTWKTSEGEKREDVDFFDCVTFGKRAEAIAKFVQKGHEIVLQTTPKQETWEDRQSGSKRSRIVFHVENFSFVGGQNPPGSGSRPTPSRPGNDKSRAERTAGKIDPEDIPTGYEGDDDDVPF